MRSSPHAASGDWEVALKSPTPPPRPRIDFGLAKVFDAALSETERSPSAAARQPAAGGLFSACGSDSYLAPEVYALRKSNTSGSASSLVPGYDGYAADMWSLGICLFAMVAGIFPFTSADVASPLLEQMAVAQAAGEPSVPLIFEYYGRPCTLTAALLGLLESLLRIDWRLRPSAESVASTPWLCAGPPVARPLHLARVYSTPPSSPRQGGCKRGRSDASPQTPKDGQRRRSSMAPSSTPAFIDCACEEQLFAPKRLAFSRVPGFA